MNMDTLTERTLVLRYATHNSHSSLYRDLYGDWHPPVDFTERDWEEVPILLKETILSVPYPERVFTELSKVDYIRASSGTSGKNLLVVPKTRVHPIKKLALNGRDRHLVTLTYFQPQHQMEIDHASYGYPITVLSGDPSNLEACTRLAANAGVNSLRTYPHLLERQLPFFEQHGLTDTINEVLMTGERLTIAEAKYYMRRFPNATFSLYYALTESQGVLGVAPIRETDISILYAPMDDYYWELIDETGRVVHEDDVEGEIVVTTLWAEGNVFPLVRYATGDIGVRRRADDGTPRYEVMGRKSLDRIKIAHGDLRVEEVERTLMRLFGRAIEYELHYYRPEDGQRPRIVLRIVADDMAAEPAIDAHTIASGLRISPSRTYETLVAEGEHAPLVCEFITELPKVAGKRKRFYIHNVV